jgi:hypothetical protein
MTAGAYRRPEMPEPKDFPERPTPADETPEAKTADRVAERVEERVETRVETGDQSPVNEPEE